MVNSIPNNIILGDAFENSLISKLLLFTNIWLNNSSIATKLDLPWIYVAIRDREHERTKAQVKKKKNKNRKNYKIIPTPLSPLQHPVVNQPPPTYPMPPPFAITIQ